jgi:hypothetical protein
MNNVFRFFPGLLALALVVQVLAQAVHPAGDRGERSLPRTTAATEQVLGSYEGQNVASIDIAGRPDLTTSQIREFNTVCP